MTDAAHRPGLCGGLDWGAAAEDYAANRAPFPDLLPALLTTLGALQPGARVLDVGTGVGTPSIQLARAGAEVTAVDPAPAMLAVARRNADAAGVTVSFAPGSGEDTGQPAAAFDLVTVGQAWHWMAIPQAPRELARVLRPDGALAICGYDWQPQDDPTGIVTASLEVVVRHAEVLPQAVLDVPARRDAWRAEAATAGFAEVAWFEVSVPAAYPRDAWRGRLRASTWVRASLDDAGVEAVDAELRAVLADGPETLEVPHALRVCVLRHP